MLTSDACIRFRSDGSAGVDASLRVSDRTFIHCCTYPADAPALAVRDQHVSVSISVRDRQKVTPADLDTARRLADAVAAYIAELERQLTEQGTAADEGEAA
jgi:hypothetical protein